MFKLAKHLNLFFHIHVRLKLLLQQKHNVNKETN